MNKETLQQEFNELKKVGMVVNPLIHACTDCLGDGDIHGKIQKEQEADSINMEEMDPRDYLIFNTLLSTPAPKSKLKEATEFLKKHIKAHDIFFNIVAKALPSNAVEIETPADSDLKRLINKHNLNGMALFLK